MYHPYYSPGGTTVCSHPTFVVFHNYTLPISRSETNGPMTQMNIEKRTWTLAHLECTKDSVDTDLQISISYFVVILSQHFFLTFFDSVLGKFPMNTVRDSFSGSGACTLGTWVSDWSLVCLRFFFRELCPSAGVDAALWNNVSLLIQFLLHPIVK